MNKSRFSEEQVIGFLKQAEGWMPIKDRGRKGGFSDARFYKWRGKFGGMTAFDAGRLQDLEAMSPSARSSLPWHTKILLRSRAYLR